MDKKDTMWFHPTSIPPDPMLTVLTSGLDEDFAKLSHTPSFMAPHYRKGMASQSTSLTMALMYLMMTFIT